jgi:hypothetical protein
MFPAGFFVVLNYAAAPPPALVALSLSKGSRARTRREAAP